MTTSTSPIPERRRRRRRARRRARPSRSASSLWCGPAKRLPPPAASTTASTPGGRQVGIGRIRSSMAITQLNRIVHAVWSDPHDRLTQGLRLYDEKFVEHVDCCEQVTITSVFRRSGGSSLLDSLRRESRMTRTPRPCAPSCRRLAVGYRRRRHDARSWHSPVRCRHRPPRPRPSTTSTAIAAEATQALDGARPAGRPPAASADYTAYLRARSQAAQVDGHRAGRSRRRSQATRGATSASTSSTSLLVGDLAARACRTGRGCRRRGVGFDCSGSRAVRLLPSRHRAAALERRPDPRRHRGRRSPTPSRATSCTTRATSACTWGRPDGPLAAVGAGRRGAPTCSTARCGSATATSRRPRSPSAANACLVNRAAAVAE